MLDFANGGHLDFSQRILKKWDWFKGAPSKGNQFLECVQIASGILKEKMSGRTQSS